MKNQLIKATLFALASVATIQAHANTSANDLILIEDLPMEQRAPLMT